mgnify:FL=1
MKPYIVCTILLFSFVCLAQTEETDVMPRDITATVVNAQTGFAMESVHVINLNQVVGTITNQEGKFKIPAVVNDTLYLSFLGFKSQKVRVTNDMFKFEGTEIALTE